MNIRGAQGPLATLAEILDCRERRAQRQRSLLGQGGCVVSFSMNIPGACKAFPLAEAGFYEGLREIRRALPALCEQEEVRSGGVTGEEVLLRLSAPAREIKQRMIALEESHPLGRLWDIDVLGEDGIGLSRADFGRPRRRCLVCGEDAKICGRSRAHSHEELFWCAAGMLDDFFRTRTAQTAARCIARAMLEEVSATPKPGLVDRANTGSHKDMDFDLFVASIRALEPYFAEFFTLGWAMWNESDAVLFAALRAAGIRAEKAMFAATGGVNTHKGMVFSSAILCGALGRLQAGLFPVSLAAVREHCAQLGRCALRDFEKDDASSAGLRCYREQSVSGIRGEAAAGFPAAFAALETLQSRKRVGVAQNESALFALMSLIASVEDTNMIHRGGSEEALRRREEAAALLPQLRAENIVPRLRELDEAYIAANLSPGGCADLLSLAMALDFLQEEALVEK